MIGINQEGSSPQVNKREFTPIKEVKPGKYFEKSDGRKYLRGVRPPKPRGQAYLSMSDDGGDDDEY